MAHGLIEQLFEAGIIGTLGLIGTGMAHPKGVDRVTGTSPACRPPREARSTVSMRVRPKVLLRSRALPAAAAVILAATACSGTEPVEASGSDAGGQAAEPAAMTDMGSDGHDMAEMVSGDRGGEGGHHGAGGHGTSQELGEGVPVPTVAVEVAEDPVEGWNLRIHTTDHRIVPENVSTGHIDGEGHVHLYIDGVKASRVYGRWHHIGALEPGEHEVRVELSSNNHAAVTVGGEIIDATATVVAAAAKGQSSVHAHAEPTAAVEPYPSVRVELVDDPAGGWSLHAVPSNFRLAPEHASGEHVDGEGHMHLYIDGQKAARLYETWYQMPPLAAGAYEISVDLRSNDHSPLTVDGTEVVTTITLEVSEDEATMEAGEGHDMGDTGSGFGHDGSADAPSRYDAELSEATRTIAVEVVSGAPVGGHQRVEVDLGSVVALTVAADGAEEVHVHGYDILRAVSAGRPAHFAFTAEIPGVFEVELERSGRLVLLLEVS